MSAARTGDSGRSAAASSECPTWPPSRTGRCYSFWQRWSAGSTHICQVVGDKMMRTSALFMFSVVALTSVQASADTFESDGVDIYYTVRGSGEPVVLIHGFLATAEMFDASGVMDALADEYEAIALDNRGHGASGKPRDAAAYGEHMVTDVINLLDHLGIEKANILGYSMGGMVTQALAIRYPERVIKAVIGGAGGSSGSDTAWVDALIASLDSGNGIGPLMVALTASGQPLPTSEQIAAANEQVFATNDPQVVAAVVRGFPELLDVTEAELRENEIPLLYLVGGLDRMKEGVDSIRTIAGNAQFKTVPDADHFTAFANPLFLQYAEEFLKAD